MLSSPDVGPFRVFNLHGEDLATTEQPQRRLKLRSLRRRRVLMTTRLRAQPVHFGGELRHHINTIFFRVDGVVNELLAVQHSAGLQFEPLYPTGIAHEEEAASSESRQSFKPETLIDVLVSDSALEADSQHAGSLII